MEIGNEKSTGSALWIDEAPLKLAVILLSIDYTLK